MPTAKSTGPTWAQMRNVLSQLEPAELIDLLQQLYKLNNDNKVFLATRLFTVDLTELAAPYRKIIKQELNPDRGTPKLNLRAARKAISDFKKASADPAALADLMIFYVEQGVICTNTYGDMYEGFYNSLESVYAEAIQVIVNSGVPELLEQFRPRMAKIVRDTSGIGWGFHDALVEMYIGDYPPEDE
jgi:hypothetical protein